MNAIIAERRISSALNRKTTQRADHIFRFGEKPLAFSENHNYWTRPLIVTHVDGTTISVRALGEKRK